MTPQVPGGSGPHARSQHSCRPRGRWPPLSRHTPAGELQRSACVQHRLCARGAQVPGRLLGHVWPRHLCCVHESDHHARIWHRPRLSLGQLPLSTPRAQRNMLSRAVPGGLYCVGVERAQSVHAILPPVNECQRRHARQGCGRWRACCARRPPLLCRSIERLTPKRRWFTFVNLAVS